MRREMKAMGWTILVSYLTVILGIWIINNISLWLGISIPIVLIPIELHFLFKYIDKIYKIKK